MACEQESTGQVKVSTVLDLQRDNVELQIEAWLKAECDKDLLRFSTAGSVDDGKSTLIGRLLYDSRNVYDDHLESVTRNTVIDFAQLTDGLRAEREQGITIDVAYRYFSTPKRKFIIADTPGHEQYTRNMATGASTADVAIVLVDARKGVLEQTRRHACIAALLEIPIVIAAVNKMDLAGFSQETFERHRQDLAELARQLEIPQLIPVPVSALEGDNVVHRSKRMRWYQGPSLLELLETTPLALEHSHTGFRLPVQHVIRPHQHFRGFAGQIASGSVCPGDEVAILPSGIRSHVRSIITWDGELKNARAPQSVVLTLDDEMDISRGDMIVSATSPPHLTNRFAATMVWMNAKPLYAGTTYLLKHTTRTTPVRVSEIRSCIDMERLEHRPATALKVNAIGEVVIETSRPLLADLYRESRATGSFILIRPDDHATAGAGMIRSFDDAAHRLDSGVLITVGNRHELAEDLEGKLLHAGSLVVRTRVTDTGPLMPLTHAGAIVIIESGEHEPITINTPNNEEQTLQGAEYADSIMKYLESAGVIPSGGVRRS
jgi:sulfate adenylyltransferase large subunit